jgi:RNA polymerase II subunit A-like phosphatase
MNGNNDGLRSPLAKRKKLSADRSGTSKLKEAISAKDLEGHGDEPATPSENGKHRPSSNDSDRIEEVDDDDDSEEVFDIDDDFLARELEEELG